MAIDVLLSKLNGVKRTGVDRGVARCPTHEDRSPSLSWRELPDGRVLLHCFAGCSVEEIVGAIGLKLEDLFPPKSSSDHTPRERKPWSDRQLLEIIDRETIIVFIAACDVTLEGRRLNEVDISRLRKARERITAVMGALS